MYSSAQILTCGKEKEEGPRPRQVLDEPLERPLPSPDRTLGFAGREESALRIVLLDFESVY